MQIKFVSLSLLLFIAVNIDCSSQNIENGPFQVGFSSYKVYDHSRTYLLGEDSISRPLLIHLWYPSQEKTNGQVLNFKHYIDLIAQREDYSRSTSEIDNNSFYYVMGYSDYAKSNFGLDTGSTTMQILNSPVAAKSGLPFYKNTPAFPLIIYAPSNGKASVQNHLICEYLASHGYMILSAASAGANSISRENMEESTEAQVMDMEFILNYAEDSLHLQYSSLGVFGFSSGGNAISLFQMNNKQVDAVISLDGGQEYGYFMKLYETEGFDLRKMDLPYLSIVNNFEDFSIYPYYNSIASAEKYIFRMPFLNHFGFISYWHFFESCSSDSILSNISISYDRMSECALGFFNKYLKSDASLFDSKFSGAPGNDYIQPLSVNYAPINALCKTLLDKNFERAAVLVEDNSAEWFLGGNQLNLLARMFNNNDISIWLYLQSLKYHPDSWQTHYDLAYVYMENGELLLAKNTLLKAQELNPESAQVTDLLNEIAGKE